MEKTENNFTEDKKTAPNINQLSEELEQLLVDFLKKKDLKLRVHLYIHDVPLAMMEGDTECKFNDKDGLKYFTFGKSTDLAGVSFFSEYIK